MRPKKVAYFLHIRTPFGRIYARHIGPPNFRVMRGKFECLRGFGPPPPILALGNLGVV